VYLRGTGREESGRLAGGFNVVFYHSFALLSPSVKIVKQHASLNNDMCM
jgi:hypothetical protein